MNKEDQSQVIVKGESGYLLVESTNSKLQLPSCKLREDEDFKAAALRCLSEVHDR